MTSNVHAYGHAGTAWSMRSITLRNQISAALLLLCAGVVMSGCAGATDGTSIANVEACLRKLDLKVELLDTATKSVEEGVTGLSKPKSELTIALAAKVKTDARVQEFQKENASLKGQLSQEQQREFTFASGSDGRYVWSVAGTKQSTTLPKARACVDPDS